MDKMDIHKYDWIALKYLPKYFINAKIEVASEKDDMENAAEFNITKVKNGKEITRTCAFRCRREKYYKYYKNEFTLRSYNKGYKTEYDKIMEGKGNYILYMFLNEDENELLYGFLGDLKVFRNSKQMQKQWMEKTNKDNNTKLKIWDKTAFEDKFVLKEYMDEDLLFDTMANAITI